MIVASLTVTVRIINSENSCEGKLKTSNDSTYEGGFNHGEKSGKGVLVEPMKQTRYEGEFYKDKFSGLGELRERGILYRGEFDLNKKVGF